MSSRCLEDAFGRRLKHALRTFLQDSLKASWSRITKTNILVLIKTYSEEVWLGQICYVICYVSFILIWRTFLQDSLKASWSRITKTNILVLIKTYSEEVWLGQICYVICYVSFILIWREIALSMIINTLVLIKTSWRRRKDVFWRRRWKRS